MRSVRPRNSGTAPASIPLFRAYFASQRVQSSGIHSTTPTTLSRSENATTRERNTISTACRNSTRDLCNPPVYRATPSRNKKRAAGTAHHSRCWGEEIRELRLGSTTAPSVPSTTREMQHHHLQCYSPTHSQILLHFGLWNSHTPTTRGCIFWQTLGILSLG